LSFLQVVPTIYTDIRGRKIYSNQVNKHVLMSTLFKSLSLLLILHFCCSFLWRSTSERQSATLGLHLVYISSMSFHRSRWWNISLFWYICSLIVNDYFQCLFIGNLQLCVFNRLFALKAKRNCSAFICMNYMFVFVIMLIYFG
jgi:hypothetical protein